MPYYASPNLAGLDAVSSQGDGYSVNIRWFQALPENDGYKIAYNIYYSTEKVNVFSEGIKYISIDSKTDVNIIGLEPGQSYYFSVRPVEYNSSQFNLTQLPIAYDNLRYYPQSLLSQNILNTSLIIPLIDSTEFPSSSIVRVGGELIHYSSITGSNLILNSIDERGLFNTDIRSHNVDGYDGYYYWNPEVQIFTKGEDNRFDRIFICQNRFEYPNFSVTAKDGYHQVLKDLLTTDLAASDEFNQDFPSYNYSGWHRTDPVQLLSGDCVGSYIGGESYCVDKYGVGVKIRGFSLQDANNQREEVLLSVTGRPAVLLKKVRTGITCACYQPSSEYADDRCPICHSKFVIGYEQYFNPRRSDGRILVRCGPADEDLKVYEGGLESEFILDFWTLTVPTIKDRDIIILFDQDNNEEFRYEVLNVTRNNTIISLEGGQKFKAQRIRKFDPAYQIRAFRDTSMFPSKINTGIGSVPGLILPHVHEIVKNEKDPSGFSQNTSVVQGHNHQVIYESGQLTVRQILGHTHTIIL